MLAAKTISDFRTDGKELPDKLFSIAIHFSERYPVLRFPGSQYQPFSLHADSHILSHIRMIYRLVIFMFFIASL